MNDMNQLSPEERYTVRMKKYKNLIAALEKTISKETMEEVHHLLIADESWFSDSCLSITLEELYSIAIQYHEIVSTQKHATKNDIRGLVNFLNQR